MKLEDEIKQSRFPNEIEKAVINIIYTSNHFYALNLQRFKPFGISPEQYNVLRILRGSHPRKLCLSDISSRMLDRNSNATRLVEKLKLKLLVTRKSCKDDRRQVDIGITDQGLDMLAKIDVLFSEWMLHYKQITEEEARTLNEILDKMRVG